MRYAIILAGGVGSRFWPLSRAIEPKQFLSFCSKNSLIEETITRVSAAVPKRNIYIATNRLHINRTKLCAKKLGIPAKNLFFEPLGKNTLAPIALLANRIHAFDEDAIVAVLPSDHLIKKPSAFRKTLKSAFAAAPNGRIITIGIRPSRPETGYGYIRISSKAKGLKPCPVEKFIEKPALPLAKKLSRDKRCYWNAGIFIFAPKLFLAEVKKFSAVAYNLVTRMRNQKELQKNWLKLPSSSIDYAVMEKTKKINLIPGDFGWVDLGSWQSIEEVLKKDKDRNILRGNTIALDCRNTIIWAGKRLVACLGLKDLVIADTKDALLVCSKEKSQELKRLVGMLKR